MSSDAPRIAIAGSRGFIGSAIAREAGRRGWVVEPLPSLRLSGRNSADPVTVAEEWIASDAQAFDALVTRLFAVDVLVNAAGLAMPDGTDRRTLDAANVAVPVVLGVAAATAGVRRMVHVSSSAVQGRRPVLDESLLVEPLTAYARSKASGEAVLTQPVLAVPREMAIYRATSVQGADRPMTQRLVRLAAQRFVLVSGSGDVPLPVALIDNVAAGIAHVCQSSVCPQVVLQPWEGMTTRSLLLAFGASRLVSIPHGFERASFAALNTVVRSSATRARMRRFELLACGQAQDAHALADLGFTPTTGVAGYERLAECIRASSRSG